MRLLHIADLHIGKRINEFSMLEEQRGILEQVLDMAEQERVDGILIAGDVYDKSQPGTEAVELLDAFLTRLTERKVLVFMISGNHDSPERLGFGHRMLRRNGLYIAGATGGTAAKISLQDAHGAVHVHLLPFVKPATVRPHTDRPIASYDDAVRAVLEAAPVDTADRNILVAHQFVISGAHQPETSDSENLSVGGIDHVDVSAFDAFDYVALGHLHGPQRMGRDTVRYAGSPLKYSFSEIRQQKSAALLELGPKGMLEIRLLPLVPRRDLRAIKGPLADLLRAGREASGGTEDYIHATLMDEEEVYDAVGQLRQVYPHLMGLDFASRHSRDEACAQDVAAAADAARKSPVELFNDFYRLQNQQELAEPQRRILQRIFEAAKERES